MAGIMSIERIVVTVATGTALLTASEPRFTGGDIQASDGGSTRVLYCRPDLDPFDGASRACGTKPTTVFERIDLLTNHPDPRVGPPSLFDYLQALLSDVEVKAP